MVIKGQIEGLFLNKVWQIKILRATQRFHYGLSERPIKCFTTGTTKWLNRQRRRKNHNTVVYSVWLIWEICQSDLSMTLLRCAKILNNDLTNVKIGLSWSIYALEFYIYYAHCYLKLCLPWITTFEINHLEVVTTGGGRIFKYTVQ